LSFSSSNLKVSALESRGVGVYWDASCKNKVTSINWGVLECGSIKNIEFYVRNEVDHPVRFGLSTLNWFPVEASRYLTLDWNYSSGNVIDVNEQIAITCSLHVPHDLKGITSFNFDISIHEFSLDDLMGITEFADAYIAYVTYGEFNSAADFNKDGIMNYLDITLFVDLYNMYRS
jgi:hypothetical protein